MSILTINTGNIKNSQTDTETVENPNKFEATLYKEIKKGKVSFENVIQNKQNSLYKLDDPRSNNIIREQDELILEKEMSVDFKMVVAGFFDLNYGTSKSPNIRALQVGE